MTLLKRAALCAATVATIATITPAATASVAPDTRTATGHAHGGFYWPDAGTPDWNIKLAGKMRYTVHDPRHGKRYVTGKWGRANWYTPNGHNVDCADSSSPISAALLQSVKFRFVIRDSYGHFIRGLHRVSVDCRGGNDNGQSVTFDLPTTRLYPRAGYWPQMRVYPVIAVSSATDAGCPPIREWLVPTSGHNKKAKTPTPMRGEKGTYCHTP